ncbi:MAG TPA: MOSC domain-containing protein [Candidatus Aquilonibacter sp.]|nr:MOSC domain-containing protein [Candidatus Aquilonibacter sp.]
MDTLEFKTASLASIQVGAPASYGSEEASDPHDQPWTTGFYKKPLEGKVFVATTNIQGDGQADLKHHGGPDKAVLAYGADHYPQWRESLALPQMPHGAFGENLTIAGLSEECVCIGDVFRIGSAIFQLSQPRQPCWKLARRWRMHELVALVVRNGRTGWYFRVLQEGWIDSGLPVELVERCNPDWTVARANRIMHFHRTDASLTLELAEVPKLAVSWVDELRERAERLRVPVASD